MSISNFIYENKFLKWSSRNVTQRIGQPYKSMIDNVVAAWDGMDHLSAEDDLDMVSVIVKFITN